MATYYCGKSAISVSHSISFMGKKRHYLLFYFSETRSSSLERLFFQWGRLCYYCWNFFFLRARERFIYRFCITLWPRIPTQEQRLNSARLIYLCSFPPFIRAILWSSRGNSNRKDKERCLYRFIAVGQIPRSFPSSTAHSETGSLHWRVGFPPK